MGVTTPRPASAGDKQRFTPGELVARRYRIVSRLGKGGMGEVFRAEDIVLGQPVALKFLPESAGNNSGLLTRFYDEVRIARQISHSNVCRVYDIGDIDGHPYLSMEYIDGEDLSSLLRRIGRLPGDKAAEFARKICAGVAAAHAQGVLHRDIKPGNIMIDGRGEPRITDFGLAAVATGIEGTEIRNGTPAYMAPEQLEGREVSVQSDLYALGLVFHEMFTGKVAHDADTIAELTKIRRDATVTRTSSLVADLDPAVDRAIQACLQPDPKLRPKSALDVARMLPGGDPLAAALAAGQTPSPEMVAAAGPSEVLAPKRALAVLGMLAVGLIAMAFTTESSSEHTPILRMAAPEVLADRARTILHSAGYSEPPVDSAWGLTRDPDFVSYMEKHVRQREQWYDILPKHPSNLKFWYRESPRGFNPSLNTNGVVSPIDPAMSIGGMTRVETGLNGELIQFTAVPPQTVKADAGSAASVEWADFFEMAKLDMTKFQPAAPEWTPLVVTDARVAWTGLQPVNYKQPIEIPLRVEAASFAGRPVYFQVIYPWTESPRNAQARQRSAAETWTARVILGLYLLFTAAAAWMALHHWRTGRGDRKGALRVAIAVGILNLIVKMLQAHHSSIDFELQFLGETIADSLFYAGLYWMFYLVMEPWVRRYWPQCLVTWTRIVQGRWRDPLVGRDALFAVTAGTVLVLSLFGMGRWIARYEQIAPVGNFAVENLEGTSFALARLVAMAQSGVSSILAFLLGMFFLRAILRKAWLAGGVFVVLGALLQMTNGRNPSVLVFLMWSIMFAIIAWVMLRWGRFAGIILIFTVNTQALNMLTTNYGAWYGTSSWISLAALAAIGLWGYRTATAGRSLLEEAPAP
jgi:serine/threonine-protein kinase